MSPGSSAAPVELIGERLILRSIDERDEELYCELFCDPETMRYIGPPWTRAAAARAFRGVLEATRRTPPRALFLMLIPKDAQRPIGLCTLQKVDPVRRQTELGVMLVPTARVQRLATEALITMIAHAFAALPVDEVWVRFAVDHAACERLALRTGLIRHADASPQDLEANLWRWSAYRSSWRPVARVSDPDVTAPASRTRPVSVHCSAAQAAAFRVGLRQNTDALGPHKPKEK